MSSAYIWLSSGQRMPTDTPITYHMSFTQLIINIKQATCECRDDFRRTSY